MKRIVTYIIVALAGAAVVAGASIAWPKLTTKPEPEVLNRVRDEVLATEVGQAGAKILGVEQVGNKPFSFSDAASSVAGAITSSVEERVQTIVSEQVAAQVVKQYEQLPAAQQTHVTEIICKPKE